MNTMLTSVLERTRERKRTRRPDGSVVKTTVEKVFWRLTPERLERAMREAGIERQGPGAIVGKKALDISMPDGSRLLVSEFRLGDCRKRPTTRTKCIETIVLNLLLPAR